MCVLLVVTALAMSLMRPSQLAVNDIILNKRPLPKCAFGLQQHAYDAIGRTACELKFSPITLQLPDLRNHLVYYGKNGRPDAKMDKPILHFGFAPNPTPNPVVAGERLYLIYDKKKSPGQYAVSPSNSETPLWIEATPQNNEVTVRVSMRNENGDIIKEPVAHAQFNLVEKETPRTGGKAWEMGKWRVDGSLLARQKARWMGPDKFLERHGGEEFSYLQNKHRIDFTDDDESYSVFLGAGDSAIWDGTRWKAVQPGEDSLRYPLMVVKKIDERLMNFELWDVGGKNKVPLTLIKINEMWMPQNLQDKFKFLGARTRSQYIFEIDDQRILLSPKDWLLQTAEDGWVKLTQNEQIDDYVERRLTGVLFVFDGVTRQEGKQVLMGVMFNAARTEMEEIALVVQQGAGRGGAEVKADDYEDGEEIDERDLDDDEDDDEDEKLEKGPFIESGKHKKETKK
ncbi:MAG: hypothetical protein H0X51_09095 [Parachlamydiaceae bacterium]|nr:hypothetical protein [Parachlamydiaceae bacterium]